MPALPTGTVSFLFTDIEGSTRLWDQFPEEMRLALAHHDSLLREIIGRHGGHVFKTIGDAFCAVFAAPSAALAAALEAQRALLNPLAMQQDWQREGCLILTKPQPVPVANPGVGRTTARDTGSGFRPDCITTAPVSYTVSSLPFSIKVRMALHTGSAEHRDNDYFGPTLNRVARLLAIGHGGQTLLSQSIHPLVCDNLPEGASLADLGHHRLRDLTQPEQVYQLLHPDLIAIFPALKSLDALPNNLPRQLTSFVGREKVMAEIVVALSSTCLLTLTGIGGCGKTRLSLQLAADMLEHFPDGVWLIELADLTDPTLVVQTTAQVLHLREEVGQPLIQALVRRLKMAKTLLIFDNCEHLLNASAQLIDTLLRLCSDVKIVASSREPLGIVGETVYRVPPLSLPQSARVQSPEALLSFESARLFMERATAVMPGFTVTRANASALAQVCRRLDGIPLAIELAAARCRALSIEQIAARLDDRFRLLTGGSRNSLPHHKTLRALIDWSYDMLSDAERILLCRLAVFTGGWSLDSAEAVCGDLLYPYYLVDLLMSLVDKSLVVYEETAGDGRYRLLETVRQYAWERLKERDEEDDVLRAHYEWYRRLVAQALPHLRGRDQAHWLLLMEREHDNLRRALDWSKEQLSSKEPADGEIQPLRSKSQNPKGDEALKMLHGMQVFWDIHSYFREGRQRSVELLAQPDVQSPTAARSEALNGVGILAYKQGDYETARLFYEESLEIVRALGERGLEAGRLNNLANIAKDQHNYERARDLYEQALKINRAAGKQDWEAANLNNLGRLAQEQKDYNLARSLFTQSLAIRRQLDEPRSIAISLQSSATLALEQERLEEAEALLTECLTSSRELGDKRLIAYAVEGMARLTLKQRHASVSARLHAAAEALLENLGAPMPEANRQEWEQDLAKLRLALGEEGFLLAWEAGTMMDWEQAVQYALEQVI